MEYAIDAGATRITAEIQNGGMTLIRITDNGCGMERQDAETAFLRHATSKLHRAEDLAAIGTLGFRGEALAAISAVSRINLLTRTADGEGTALTLEGGTITDCTDAGCPKGTTIVVRDLFFNTPARLKFMKSDAAEGANVTAVMQRLAIAHPEIAMELLRDGQRVVQTAGDGQLLSVVAAVFGRQAAKEMIPLAGSWGEVRISGYISRPSASRGSRSYQVFFVNGRYVKSRTMTAALEEAYRNQIMSGRFPACVIDVRLPLARVDVNVHPAKTEVRFLAEKEVFDGIRYGAEAALRKDTGKKELRFPGTPKAEAARQAGAKPEFYREMNSAQYRAFLDALGGMPPLPQKPAGMPQAEAPADDAAGAELCSPVQLPALSGTHGIQNRPSEAPDVCKPEDAAMRGAPEEAQPAQRAAAGAWSGRERAAQGGYGGEPTEAAGGGASPAISAADAFDRAAGAARNAIETGAEQTAQNERAADGRGTAPGTQRTADGGTPMPETDAAGTPEQTVLPLAEAPAWRIVGEVLNCYILVEEADAILFIDKHAAHERLLFETLKKQDNRAMSQVLLAPIPVVLPRESAAVLLENRALLSQCGYEIDEFGDGTVLIRQIPDYLDESEAEAVLAGMAADLLAGRRADPDAMRDELLHTIACKAAIKGGFHTDAREREALVREVLTRDDLKYCPHGRPVCIRLTEGALRRQFKRS